MKVFLVYLVTYFSDSFPEEIWKRDSSFVESSGSWNTEQFQNEKWLVQRKNERTKENKKNLKGNLKNNNIKEN